MLYFLVFAIPFSLTIYYLVRRMFLLRKKFIETYDMVMDLAKNENFVIDKEILNLPTDLIITDSIIKKLEWSLRPIEQRLDINFVFISNTAYDKKQKLIKIQNKIQKIQKILAR